MTCMIVIWCCAALLFGSCLIGEIADSRNCICTTEYLPVKCANGETYGNPCLAKCAGAEECKLIYDGKSHIYLC